MPAITYFTEEIGMHTYCDIKPYFEENRPRLFFELNEAPEEAEAGNSYDRKRTAVVPPPTSIDECIPSSPPYVVFFKAELFTKQNIHYLIQ